MKRLSKKLLYTLQELHSYVEECNYMRKVLIRQKKLYNDGKYAEAKPVFEKN